ncbi:MAG: NAD(P)/FAD-dependent oxidoreductase [Alphaproteobacteria bacterium]
MSDILGDVDAAVIGAGVIGLACARRLAQAGLETLVLEAADAIGTEISSRNSEVVHAGIYYPTGSLKARWCVAGKAALYDFCRRRGIAHRRLGKLIVAAREAEIAGLERLQATARANGVGDLEWLDAAELARREPAVRGAAALLSPSTGIVDSHGVMVALQGDAEARGAMIAFNTRVIGGARTDRGICLRTQAGDVRARIVVNAAGLDAPAVAGCIAGVAPASVPRAYLAKGSYYVLHGKAPFRHLIYPMPEPGGLGVHVTLDLAGQARFGPDVEWVETRDYAVDPRRADRFYAAARAYWPGLPDGALAPAYAGIRPKISGPGEANADFVLQDTAEHGVDGLINLYGIESPGLTACLAIADAVAERLGLDPPAPYN